MVFGLGVFWLTLAMLTNFFSFSFTCFLLAWVVGYGFANQFIFSNSLDLNLFLQREQCDYWIPFEFEWSWFYWKWTGFQKWKFWFLPNLENLNLFTDILNIATYVLLEVVSWFKMRKCSWTNIIFEELDTKLLILVGYIPAFVS